ncbi:ribonuclease D [Zoogloea sp.]|uniref:ribonuclease D n=1 Tax=Zoogloea sp. TaxID=49181 RepID=UPI0025ECB444|nr:ribonuclease D [Zoogloea sp.]
MPVEPLAPPVWVNTPQSLARMAADLASQPRIAVDTESNSLHAYRERVCLIQFSTPQTDYLVDPIILADLSELAPIFADPNIEKIFHAAEYDLICLRRDFDFTFANLFDTMQASRILGYPAVGLDKLLDEKFGIKVDKRHQKADWGARPLKPDQIHYARFDTHYLCALRDVLELELIEKGRLPLAQEDFRRACEVDESRPKANGEAWERFAGRRDLNLRDLTILSELLETRDELAAQRDRPPFKVIEDDKLIAIARSAASDKEGLIEAGMSEKQIRLWGGPVIEAVKRGVERPLVKRRPIVRPSDAVAVRLDKLKNWRKTVAQQMGVESDVILPKPFVQLLAERAPRTAPDLEVLMAPLPWRYQQFGGQLLKLLGG